MLKIALLGVDSGHFDVFADLIRKDQSQRMSIHSIWGENLEQAFEKTNALGIETNLIKNNIDEALDGAQAAMVIGRFADSHLLPSLKCLQKKIPVFIDKPVANSVAELEQIIKCSNENKTPFESFSIYRFSDYVQTAKRFISNRSVSGLYLTGPRYCKDLGNDPRFNDIYFYGIHSVEILLEVLGEEFGEVRKLEKERSIHAILDFKTGATAVVNFASDLEQEFYFLNIVTDKGLFTQEIKYDEQLYERTINHLVEFFSTDKKIASNESNVSSLKILDHMRGGRSL